MVDVTHNILSKFLGWNPTKSITALKPVELTAAEIQTLCQKSREIFLKQPILLELEVPLKICGKILRI